MGDREQQTGERIIRGTLIIEASDKTEAIMLVAELTARMRSLGWNCDEITVEIESSYA